MSGFDLYIRTKADLEEAVERLGFVPLFQNSVPGFSVEEHVAREAWFSSEEGVWEWKGPVIREAGCAYGKFFEKKAVFISREWFPDFANYRRDGYDFDARYEDELASRRDLDLYTLLADNAPILSRRLKEAGHYTKDGRKGFDTIITRLQMQGYALVSDFVYEKDRYGNPYGWGVAEYSTPEQFFGEEFRTKVYQRKPQESYMRLLGHLHELLPEAEEKELQRILR